MQRPTLEVFTDQIWVNQTGRQGPIAPELLSWVKGVGTKAETQVCWGSGEGQIIFN